jgi:hypothetical protein
LNEVVGANGPCERFAYIVRIELEIKVRGAKRFVERETELGSAKHSSRQCIFARFSQRKLSQQKRLRLVKFSSRNVFGSHL